MILPYISQNNPYITINKKRRGKYLKGDYSNEFHFLNAKPFPVVKQS